LPQFITGAVHHRAVPAIVAAIVGVSLVTLAASLSAREAEGPVASVRPLGPAPRAADGRFENWTPQTREAGVSVTFPFFLRRAAARFRNPVGLPGRLAPEIARAGVASDVEPRVTWIGHATLLVQMSGVAFLTDPIWSDTAGPAGFGALRYDEPGLAFEDLPEIDFVVVSHNHYDHLDLSSLLRIAERSPAARFLVPLGNGALLRGKGIENVVEFDWGEQLRVGAVTVHCLPSQHWSQRGLTDLRRALWASWAVTSSERRFWFGGDTGAFEGFDAIGHALGPFDLAAVPIGAYEPQAMMRYSHLDPEEAVAAAVALGARRVLGMHFGTFDLSDEPIDEPPRRFRAAGQAAGIAEADVLVLDLGETRRF
jgi:N-acyl-phosphatidylethanolamine-hydrolysing phospholipase D